MHDDTRAIDEIISLLNFSHEKLKTSRDDLVTYEDDSEADHQDGQFVGRATAYREMIKECGRRLQAV